VCFGSKKERHTGKKRDQQKANKLLSIHPAVQGVGSTQKKVVEQREGVLSIIKISLCLS
jgi:hypothetical protein